MDTESRIPDQSFFRRWLVASVLGWFLGFVLIIVLALLADLIGGGVQFIVGVGMGAGVGFMQGRLVGNKIASLKLWVLASVFGMGLPFVAWDIAALLGKEFPLSAVSCVVVGGLLTGLLQWRILSRLGARTIWWVPASVSGWTLAAGWMEFAVVVVILFGGAILGAVTGFALTRILPEEILS